MRSPEPGKLPLYKRIMLVLRDEILTNRYDGAACLPSEATLEQRFAVSRITIRKAFDELEKAGLISRSKGAKARVLPRRPAPVSDVHSETEAIKLIGLDMTPEVLTFSWVMPDEPLAELLSVSEAQKILWVERVRRRLGSPVSYSCAYIPPWSGQNLSAEILQEQQLLDVWQSNGIIIASAEQTINALPCSRKIARILEVAEGSPVLNLRRLMRDDKGIPIGLMDLSWRWDRFTYRMDLKRTGNELQTACMPKRTLHGLEDTLLLELDLGLPK
ncbi:MAG: GntR family transcriptional regulator [Acetobacter sp.]|uniref:GntR family transcriptional regulator n=1 Tax=Acetobacter sp. TaxID=440 RepID=UPI0039EB8937